MTNALEDKPLPIYGDGTAVRDYIFVEDHCRGIDTALRAGSPGEDYNIGAGGEVNGLAAVSYTHLDVYKRQVVIRYVGLGGLALVATTRWRAHSNSGVRL